MKATLSIAIIILCFSFSMEGQRKNKKKAVAQIEVAKDDSISFNQLKWRNIGPFRGGRSVTSTGVVGQDMTYYMGTTGGGIWKTTDDGINWKNISDGFLNTGTVGAIAVAESNPNVVIAGMGEHAARGVMTSMGDGVYKSTDAGKTWKHIGLDNTRHISDVIIDPNNHDIIFIAAQGAQYGPSSDRGIYRSLDGGNKWEKVLFVNEITGASSLTMDMKNPLILYASMWQHERKPWTIESGGSESGLYKSNDGGNTWKKMEKGLPKAFGKSGISVSRANPDRVFAVIEAEGKKAGVYRSEDAGKKWTQINSDRINITRSWYYMEIFADPQNEEIVYVMNAPAMKSIDGGKSFNRIPTPHGDNHHLWINPNDNQKMINSNDGGANISNNGGKSWSTQKNQATSQFYRVITDNLVPYNVYGGQQDNSAISIKSRTNGQGINWKDWHSVSGCESAFLAFDPNDPELIYGGCYQGIIEKFVTSSKEAKAIKEYPELGLSIEPVDFKYRYNWNAPIISSSHDRKTIYHAGNVVFRTNDEGQTWKVISPDLTRNIKEQQGPGGGPYTNEAAGGENYHTLMALVESEHEEGTLWAGSDDGLVHITRNAGETWENVTPANMKEGIVNSIEVSPHDAATAYIVLMRYKLMDLKSYIYKTNDYGKSWTLVVNGMDDPHSFTRAVRADKKVKGLLYAGTETGLYLSHNDGADWKKIQLNLPVVPINDLIIQDNDLVVATAGRSFWILDDLAPLQSMKMIQRGDMVLQPKDAYLLFGGSSDKPVSGLGQNPKQRVSIDYYLSESADSSDLTLEILKGDIVIRSYSNAVDKDFKTWEGGPSKPAVIPSKEGFNRFTWNFNKETLPSIDKVFVYGNYSGSRVGPGAYKIRLTRDSSSFETTVNVLANPKINASAEDYMQQQQMLDQVESLIKEIHNSVNGIRSVKSQLLSYNDLLKDNKDASELRTQGDSLISRIDTWERNLIQPDQKTFQDVINFNNKLNAQLMHLKSYLDQSVPAPTTGAKTRLSDLTAEWKVFQEEQNTIVKTEMLNYNKSFKALGLPALIMKE